VHSNLGNDWSLPIMPNMKWTCNNDNTQRRDGYNGTFKHEGELERVVISRTEVAVLSERTLIGHFV
jgi:hypothetical protein